MHYIYANGIHALNSLGSLQEMSIQEKSINSSESNKLYISLISFISMGIITLVGIFTFPLLGKIEDRKISVLKFFNALSLEQILDMLDRGREFQVEFVSL